MSLAIVRGGGDLATGIVYRLWKIGFKVIALEIEKPLVIRRTVSVAQAIFGGECQVEDMLVRRIENIKEAYNTQDVSVIVDPKGTSIEALKPMVVVDAILAKKNLGTTKSMAPIVIGIGPGFAAGEDVDAVIESKRGHYLGRVIYRGQAAPDTGIPGIVMGHGKKRVIRAPRDGYFEPLHKIGDFVEQGDLLGHIEDTEVLVAISGVLRGIIHPSIKLWKGLKMGDIDPRGEKAHCFSISDKALAIAGGALEAIFYLKSEMKSCN